MNNFIVSGNGFLESTTFNKQLNKIEVKWTPLLRNAQKFKTKSAKEIIEKNNLEAFIWNPYLEEPIKNKWMVIKRTDHYDFFNDEKHISLEYKPLKVVGENKTDLKFLTNNNVNQKIYYDSYEEALIICEEKNNEIIRELESKILNMKINNNQWKNK